MAFDRSTPSSHSGNSSDDDEAAGNPPPPVRPITRSEAGRDSRDIAGRVAMSHRDRQHRASGEWNPLLSQVYDGPLRTQSTPRDNPFSIVAQGPRSDRLQDQIRPGTPPPTDNPTGVPAPSPPAIRPRGRRRIRDVGTEESSRPRPLSEPEKSGPPGLDGAGRVKRTRRVSRGNPRTNNPWGRALTPETDENDDELSRKYKRAAKAAQEYISRTKGIMAGDYDGNTSGSTASDQDSPGEEQREASSDGDASSMVVKMTISENLSRADQDKETKLQFLQKKLRRGAPDLRQAQLP